jgi:6-phosphofructokinase 1
VVEAVDKIRDTAESHNRIFVVEVMGRDSGLIALYSGIGVGAEGIMIPESKSDLSEIMNLLSLSRKDKKSKIIIVSEGDEDGGAQSVSEKIKSAFPEADVRVTILGHVQRGGAPTCMERVNAARMGHEAVNALLQGREQQMVGIVNGKINFTPFENAVKQHVEPDQSLLSMTKILAS